MLVQLPSLAASDNVAVILGMNCFLLELLIKRKDRTGASRKSIESSRSHELAELGADLFIAGRTRLREVLRGGKLGAIPSTMTHTQVKVGLKKIKSIAYRDRPTLA